MVWPLIPGGRGLLVPNIISPRINNRISVDLAREKEKKNGGSLKYISVGGKLTI